MHVQTSSAFIKKVCCPLDEGVLSLNTSESRRISSYRSARWPCVSRTQARHKRAKRNATSTDTRVSNSRSESKSRESAESVGSSRALQDEAPVGKSYDIDVDIFSDEFPYSVADSKEGPEPGPTSPPGEVPTELIIKLDRRGYGWGEEIIPRLTVERRPIAKKKSSLRNRSKTPTAWEEGSLECLLAQAGVLKEQVESVAAAASAWRVTPGGRPLIDRKRRTRVARNIKHVIDYLVNKCGIPAGPEGVGAIITQSPQILLANPKQHDRWFRRVVELSAFIHRYDHCNVPDGWPESPSLAIWVDRQRAQKAQGTLCEERLQMLYAVGFEFGEVAVITQEWEVYFDTLVDWLMWHTERRRIVDWNGIDWIKQGGYRAGQLATWVQLQRELLRRELLPNDAKQRLDALGFQWTVPGFRKQAAWMHNFGKLMFAMERRKMKTRRRRAYSPDDIEIAGDAGRGSLLDVFSEKALKSATGTWSSQESERSTFFSSASFSDNSREKNPKLDRLAGIRFEVGVGYWLTKQRCLWRRGKLDVKKKALLLSAGVDLNQYSLQDWVDLAQKAANFLNGYEIWVKPLIAAKLDKVEQSNAKNDRLYVEPNEIKEILSDGGVVEWPQSPKQGRGSSAKQNSGEKDGDKDGLPEKEDYDKNSPGTVSARLKIRRWILTQQALWKEDRLSQEQLRHLAFLGLTWILSKDVTHMSEVFWQARFCDVVKVTHDLSDMESVPMFPSRLKDWLMHQRGLRRLGWLSKNRIEMLNELGFKWTFRERSKEDKVWDARLAEVLEFKQEHNHCQVSEKWALGRWLSEQQKLMQNGHLSALRSTQLEALGIQSGQLTPADQM
ncbi:hypothetical protein BSKO_02923 [Bryopsis sp. KO-2023]|nr:hypothetical protein BSKO_02923 [Bryopsis sp. KO-2023]